MKRAISPLERDRRDLSKLYKLWVHQKAFSVDELVLNSKDFPDIKQDDIVEVYHPDQPQYSRLLLQVKTLREDALQQKDIVSIAQDVATCFHLRQYKDVKVNIVNPQNVALDLVELTYRDQYFSRADMYRVKQYLVKKCLYLNKKLTFCEMRAVVNELWSKGEKVTCGVVTEDTRVTYRSHTAQVNIFMQMSSEMWEFDNYGDLYFEKAVGYLRDLFSRWKERKCSHDVTITMFSRTYYKAKAIEEFPMYMRECVQVDYQGRFYEDFYRVVVQNERYEEWTSTLVQLKKIFIQYQERVLKYHQREGVRVPEAWNSSAAQGNFLQVLNMALNVFEKYYLDRCFDRTGKISIVITPGVGVFEVDRDLTNITKQRTIDCGNSSDLVCMGEQPLHAVPLFKFHNMNPEKDSMDVGDDYNIPHWINHSFYTSRSQGEYMKRGKFIPRIKMQPVQKENISPENVDKRESYRQRLSESSSESSYKKIGQASHSDDDFRLVDYDEYDAQVFKLPNKHFTQTEPSSQNPSSGYASISDAKHKRVRRVRCISEMVGAFNDVMSTKNTNSVSPAIGIPVYKRKDSEEFMSNSFGGHSGSSSSGENITVTRPIVGSAGSVVGPPQPTGLNILYKPQPHRALINPFAPSRLHFKVTSNRRRWAHAFPTDTKGATVQTHHSQSSSSLENKSDAYLTHRLSPPTKEVIQAAQFAVELRRQRHDKLSISESSDGGIEIVARGKSVTISSNDSGSSDSLKDTYLSAGGKGSLPYNDSASSFNSVINTYEMVPSIGSYGKERSRTYSHMLAYSRSSSYHKDLSAKMSGGPREEGHNWLWGMSGEQEWTLQTTTGMDWKSMTMPASLPISTDYFPDKRSLQIDYVVSDYSIEPEVVNAEIGERYYDYVRQPLSTQQLYNEMILQRIAQGFQLVVSTKKITSNEIAPTSSIIRVRAKSQPQEELTLSIGRIFHKLTLMGSTITVTRYWPRHPYPQKENHYTYRFQVPDSDSYDVSWTTFKGEKLENYNWNYVDHYICSRGEEEFSLSEPFKYWRARYFLLPCNNPATRKIIEDHASRCDIYDEKSIAEQETLIEGFLRFLEIANKMKRPGQSRKPKTLSRRSSLTQSPGAALFADKERDRSEGTYPSPANKVKMSSMGKMSEAMDSPPHSLITASPGGPADHRKGILASSNSETAAVTMGYSGQTRLLSEMKEDSTDLDTLTIHSPLIDIVGAMADPHEGLCFLTCKQPGLPELPSNSFVAAEATAWIKQNVEGVDVTMDAIKLLQKMVDERLISHASNHPQHKFINGFYLFYIINQQKKERANHPNRSFHFQWCEVAVHHNIQHDDDVPLFFKDTIPGKVVESAAMLDGDKTINLGPRIYSSHPDTSPVYKMVNVDIDPANQKTEREEWGTAKYHGNYNPSAAFELELQFLVATGAVVGDLIATWCRKAGSCGFHFLPVPGDIFALPFNANSDPLRGPIFVPLDINCLKTYQNRDLFEDFSLETREQRLLLFQEAILKRFGFLMDRPLTGALGEDFQPQYVHCTGGMFVLLPDNKTTSPRNRDGTHRKPDFGSYKDYIAWQRKRSESTCSSSASTTGPEEHDKVGFLWAWNFMLSKRWRSSNTGDEHFQDKVFADFRAFCSNSENRLRDFWEESKSLMVSTDIYNFEQERYDANGVRFSVGD